MLRTQLRKLPEQNARRMANVKYFFDRLRQVEGLTPVKLHPDGETHSHYLVMLRYDSTAWGGLPRGRFLDALNAEGVPATAGYSFPSFDNPVLNRLDLASPRSAYMLGRADPIDYRSFRGEVSQRGARLSRRSGLADAPPVPGRYGARSICSWKRSSRSSCTARNCFGISDMPSSPLQTLDWLVIGSYFFMLLIIALYYRRFAGRNLDEFFLGGRRNSGWANGLAYAGAMMNADVAPAYSGFAVTTGVFVCWFYLSRFGIALFLGAILFAVFWRRLNLFTTPEFYELRFGGTASRVIRTWVALKSALLAMVAWTSTGLLAMHKIGGPILGFESKTTTMLVVVPVVLGYVFVSGFAGSAATSSLHTLIMLIGSALLCGIVLWQNGGPEMLATQLQAAAGPDVLSAVPPIEHGILPLAAVLAWMIGTSLGYGGDTAPLGGAMEGQYLFSSKNAREASKMYIVAEVSLFLLLLLITLPSMAAMIDWPQLRLPPGAPQHMDREMAYGLLMSKYLPTGLLGLLFVGMLASVLSTIGGNLTFGAQVLVSDIYRRYLRPHQSERHYVWVGRVAIVLILALALAVAYRVELIFDVAAFMVAASVAEMPANWAQWWWWRFNAWGRLAASFGGLRVTVIVWFVPPTSCWPWWDRTYLVLGLNMGLTALVTLLTPPDRHSILERFYRDARPLGVWQPVRDRLCDDLQETPPKTQMMPNLALLRAAD